MIIHRQDETLNITGVKELGLANRDSFSNEVRAALTVEIRKIVIDFSETSQLDCSGLGALVALHKTARSANRKISFCLMNPPPPVRRLLDLTKMALLFSIADSANRSDPALVPAETAAAFQLS